MTRRIGWVGAGVASRSGSGWDGSSQRGGSARDGLSHRPG